MPTNELGGIPSGWSNLTPVKWRARGYGLDTNRTIEELRAANVPLIFVANCWMVNALDFEFWLRAKYTAAGGTMPVDPEDERRRELVERLNQASKESLAGVGALPKPAEAAPPKPNGDAPTPPEPKRKRRGSPPRGESR